MSGFVSNYGYLGAFLISIFGNFTIIFPVPHTLTIYAFGSVLNPLLLGISCGLGSTIGEFSAYLIGLGGRRVIEEKYNKRLESAKLLIQRYGMLTIFLFALLPLPDDLIIIPLGILRYDIRKAIVSMLVGKTAMCILIAYAGKYSFDFVRELFEAGGLWSGILAGALLVIIIFAMIRIDWTRFVKPKNKEG
jgi:membrane protein YqaA with SNARE-associated domain